MGLDDGEQRAEEEKTVNPLDKWRSVKYLYSMSTDEFTFKLEINLPISASMTADDLTDKLREVARDIDRRFGTPEGVEHGEIRDAWQTLVGEWEWQRRSYLEADRTAALASEFGFNPRPVA